jgi:hypothetical protein
VNSEVIWLIKTISDFLGFFLQKIDQIFFGKHITDPFVFSKKNALLFFTGLTKWSLEIINIVEEIFQFFTSFPEENKNFLKKISSAIERERNHIL